MKVTACFVRNLRKALLSPDGTPRAGCAWEASVLLTVTKGIQRGNYQQSIAFAKLHGYDLEQLYASYTETIAPARSFLEFLGMVKAWCEEYGHEIVWAKEN